MNVKLGHRRVCHVFFYRHVCTHEAYTNLLAVQKLQRAIAESRGQSSDRPLTITLARGASVEGTYRSDDSANESKSKQGQAVDVTVSTSTKRKYRRHPKVGSTPTLPPPRFHDDDHDHHHYHCRQHAASNVRTLGCF